MASGENYRIARERLALESWDTETCTLVTREPTNAELLHLLDAMHYDVMGTVGPELEEVKRERWYNS